MTMRRSAAFLTARRASVHTSRIDVASRRPESSSTRALPVSVIASAAIVVMGARSKVHGFDLRAEDAHAVTLVEQRLVALRHDARAARIHLHGHVPSRPVIRVRALRIRGAPSRTKDDVALTLQLGPDR